MSRYPQKAKTTSISGSVTTLLVSLFLSGCSNNTSNDQAVEALRKQNKQL